MRDPSTEINVFGTILLFVVSFSVFADAQLSSTYYSTSCPRVSSIVDSVVANAVSKAKDIAAALLRLHFHDCFVRGCDASVLIDSNVHQQAEKDGIGNANSLRGFEVIDAVKTALERSCPGVVSCADILALSARSAIYRIGGPSWSLQLGRRDGVVSIAAETTGNLPPPFAQYPELINMFASKGLSEQDMVTLSGAHTIGITHCGIIESRLYNSSGLNGVDPTLDPAYASQLKTMCPYGPAAANIPVPMDPTLGNNTFDSSYYKLVKTHQGLFTSDAVMISDPNGKKFVNTMSYGAQYPFFSNFAAAMTKMSNIQLLVAPAGEVRFNCHVMNSALVAPGPPITTKLTPASAPAPSTTVPAPAPTPKTSATPTPAPAPKISPTPGPAPAPVLPPTPTSVPTPNLSPTPASAPSRKLSPTLAPAPPPKLSPTSAPAPATTATTPVPSPASAPAPATSATTPVPTPASAPAPALSVPAPQPLTPNPAPSPNPLNPSPAPSPVKAAPVPSPAPSNSTAH